MFDLNVVNITGRFGQKPELKQLENGTFLVNFDLACKVDGNVTEWLPCTAWGDTAQFIVKFFDKGSRVAIEGNYRVHTYEKNGQKIKSTYCDVRQAHFIDGKNAQPAAATTGAEPNAKTTPTAAVATPPAQNTQPAAATEPRPPMIDLNEEDLPF